MNVNNLNLWGLFVNNQVFSKNDKALLLPFKNRKICPFHIEFLWNV